MSVSQSRTIVGVVRSPRQIGEALRRQRRRLKLSQASLGERAGLRQATVSALERGEGRVNSLTVLLAALDLELVVRIRRTEPGRSIEDIF